MPMKEPASGASDTHLLGNSTKKPHPGRGLSCWVADYWTNVRQVCVTDVPYPPARGTSPFQYQEPVSGA